MLKRAILASFLFTPFALETLCKEGPNDCQPAPVVSSAVNNNGKITVKGKLKAKEKTKYIIQFFGNPAVRDGITEGADFLGQVIIKTNEKGFKSFCAKLPVTQNTDPFISATATSIEWGKPGDTSQFSESVSVTFVG